MQQARTRRISRREMRGMGAAHSETTPGMRPSVKVCELAEEDEAVVDFFAGEGLDALGAEALNGEGTHDAAVEHGAAEGGRGELRLRCLRR